MVQLPGGKFIQGATKDQTGAEDERPAREVTLSPFEISEAEITYHQYYQFIVSSGYTYDFDSLWQNGVENSERPVGFVTWKDARNYAEWLSSKYDDRKCRLPSESEWEYAARSKSKTDNYWGSLPESAINTSDYAVYQANNVVEKSAHVKSKKPNEFGLYDVIGNVAEWTLDCYHNTYLNAPINGNPVESTNGSCPHRVIRGGAFNDEIDRLRSRYRMRTEPGTLADWLGFRVVCNYSTNSNAVHD